MYSQPCHMWKGHESWPLCELHTREKTTSYWPQSWQHRETPPDTPPGIEPIKLHVISSICLQWSICQTLCIGGIKGRKGKGTRGIPSRNGCSAPCSSPTCAHPVRRTKRQKSAIQAITLTLSPQVCISLDAPHITTTGRHPESEIW